MRRTVANEQGRLPTVRRGDGTTRRRGGAKGEFSTHTHTIALVVMVRWWLAVLSVGGKRGRQKERAGHENYFWPSATQSWQSHDNNVAVGDTVGRREICEWFL